MTTRNYTDRLESYKTSIVGRTVYWLTCIDVIYENNAYTAKCQCKCGNIKLVPASRFAKGNIKKSCGCYRYSQEFAEKQRKYILDRPEIIENSIKKTKEWHDNNPDKVKERNKKVSNWFKENPDKVKEKERRHRQWFKDNPDKVRKQAEHFRHLNAIRRADTLCNTDLSFVHSDDVAILLSPKHNSHSIVRTKCPKCGEYCGHSFHSVYNYTTGKLTHRLCKRCYASGTSYYEDNIQKFISTFYSYECIRNYRKVIPPLELDLYYPEKKVAIEFNGDYWHSNKFKTDSYHYDKFRKCLDKGVLLVSIFELDWHNRRQLIESYLRDLFNSTTNKLSYIGNLMNNNYPDPNRNYSNQASDLISDYYIVNESKIYTCGFTKFEN